MSRATDLCELHQNAVKMLTQNPQEWIGLLASAAKFYKLSFDKNVLVYMQRPEAGLIATMRDWNIRTGRYVNKHSKAIAVLDMSDPKARLTYYFDFADTHGDLESLQKTMELIWKVENQYKSDLLMRFQEKYGTAGKSIEEALVQMVMQQTEKILNLYMEGFAVREPESILYGAPLEAVKDEFATYVQNSAVYIVLKKCGLSTDIISEDAFNHISHYGSLELFMQLGACSTAAARTVLRQIYQRISRKKGAAYMSREALMPLEYTEREDGMLYPNLNISKEKQYDQIPTGKYGKIWKEFMMECHPERMTELILRGEINRMITKVDEEAEERKEQLIQKLLENQPMPVNGTMMNRAAHMNLLMMTAEEVIIREVVCQMR